MTRNRNIVALPRFFDLLTSILVLVSVVAGQSNNVWNGIIPLKSTRADVEKILGNPTGNNGSPYAAGYKTKDGTVFVLYSTGMCDANPEHGWNIPELTVIHLTFSPDYPNPHKFSALKIDKGKYEKHPDPESPYLVSYDNERDGINLTVDITDDSVRTFGFFPESKYKGLMCKNIKVKKLTHSSK